MATLLVIDDHPLVLETIRQLCEELGHRVFACASGALGIEEFAELRPSLVLCDLFMPGLDGIETLRAIKEIDAEAKVVLMSGFWDKLSVDAPHLAECLGASGVLSKPLKSDELRHMIEETLV